MGDTSGPSLKIDNDTRMLSDLGILLDVVSFLFQSRILDNVVIFNFIFHVSKSDLEMKKNL